MFYLVTWSAIFFGANRLFEGRRGSESVNVFLVVAFVAVSYVLVARRLARRDREYPARLSPGDWRDAPAGAAASERGGGSDEGMDAEADDFDDEEELPYDWPRCPHCGRPRLTSCPVCETAGSGFTPAYLPVEAEIAESATAEGLGYHVLCPTCDEPFWAEFPSECEWCGHRFRDGRAVRSSEPVVTSPFADMNERAWIVVGGLVATVAAIVALFVWLASRR